jgi:lipopolysaccharide export system permease protein
VMVVAYHKVNQYGEDVAALGRVDPFLALWGPFMVFAALIGWMFYRVAHVPGGQAIGPLEQFFARIARRAKALWRRQRINRAEATHAA